MDHISEERRTAVVSRAADTPMRFTVWAPGAARVELEVGGRVLPMARARGGWWSAGAACAPGADYAFRVDGGPPLPDPRAPWLPHGPSGPARRVDHSAFPWRHDGFQPRGLEDALIYELHVGTFTPEGTFAAVESKLGHLAGLGVTHVELMPVGAFPGVQGWGYDGVGLFAPHAAYGTPEDLKRLVDACHGRGLAVLLDVVYNHLGPSGNVLGTFGPYFTGQYRTPWGDAVNLDGPGSDEVRRFFLDNVRQWLEDYRFDGVRLDAVHAFVDRSAVPFVEELTAEVAALSRRLGRRLAVIAESDLNDPRVVRPRHEGGWGCDAQWSDDFHHALHALFTGERQGYYGDFGGMAALAKALRQAWVYDGAYAPSRGRRHGRPPRGLPGQRFLGYAQNHDQVGNRARGERTAHLLDPARLRIVAAMVLAAPFVPMLFQGEEWGSRTPFLYFTDHQDPRLAAAVSRGRRQEFAAFADGGEVPDPQDHQTFRRSKLDWNEPRLAPHSSLLDWHRALVRLRRERSDLGRGPLSAVAAAFDEERGWFRMDRGGTTVAFNLGAATVRLPLPRPGLRVILSSDEAVVDQVVLDLPPESVAILG